MKAMPPHIKECFLYRKVYRDVWVRKKNAGFVVTGPTGSGKSWFALKMAHDLDPEFTAERVVFNTEEFLKLLVEGDSHGKLHPGSAVVFDETSHEEAMDSRSSLSEVNKQMAALSTIYRALRLIVFYVAPNLLQIDSRVRAVSITALLQLKHINYETKKSKADIYWSVQNSRTGEVYYKRPRSVSPNRHIRVVGSVSFGMPPQDLIDDYEDKKVRFIRAKLEKWYASTVKRGEKKSKNIPLTIKELAYKISKNKDIFMADNRISYRLIMKEFGCGKDKARDAAEIASIG